jgi:MFS family permease
MPTPASSRASMKARMFSALANPEYRILWIGMIFSMAAMQFNVISRAWLAYHISGSALALGIVTAARGLPQLALFPLSGYIADRLDKRLLVVVSQVLLAVLALINALLVQFDVIQVWHLVVIGLCQGFIFPFNQLARQAYIPYLVPDSALANALSLNASARNTMQVIAPSLAGVCLAFDPVLAFYAITAFYCGAICLVWQLPSTRRSQQQSRGLLQEMTLGFRSSWNHPTLRTITVMLFFVIVLGRPYQQLLPIFQASVLHVGPSQLGMMYTTVGLGAMVGSFMVTYLSESVYLAFLMMACGVGFGLSLTLFSCMSVFHLALACLFLVGLTSQSYLTINSVLTVWHCDRAVYARVVSVRQMIMSLMTVSTVPITAIVDLVGPQRTMATAGLLLTAAILLTIWLMPRVTVQPVPAAKTNQ